MRARLVLTLTVSLLALGLSQGAQSKEGAHDYIVVLKANADVNAVLGSYERGTSVHDVYSGALNGFAARLSPKTVSALESDSRVLFVSADRPVHATGQQTPTGVSRIGAGNGLKIGGVQTAGEGVGVAVIDTGIDLTHPDLAPVQKGMNCVDHSKPVTDDNGHGTHVAGIIAARDNGIGVVGVAPAATLYAIKALDSSASGTWASVICGIVWAANHPGLVRVVNMSFTGSGTATPSNLDCSNGNNDAFHYAICRATKLGITFIAAAGNDSSDAANTVPAAYVEVIAVSAIADSDGKPGGLGPPPACLGGQLDDHFATFSNFGAVVDLAAPGVCILSTYIGDGYATLSGTSMAAPHVAGAAALYLQTHPLATPDMVRSGLLASAEPGPIPGDPDPYHEGVVHVTSLDAGVLGPLLPPLPQIVPSPPTTPTPSSPPLIPPLLPTFHRL
jgi:subtilisin family serine protease